MGPLRRRARGGGRARGPSRPRRKGEKIVPVPLARLSSLALAADPNADIDLLNRAYRFAERGHREGRRASGDPYITHPLEVAEILAEHRFDSTTLAAGLLHDLIEDTSVTEETLRREFGEEIANIVSGVTKLSTIPFKDRERAEAENLRRMLVAMSRDIRVLVIKLADRLHNMRTIDALVPEKIRRISKETLEIYAPLGERMGMSAIQHELEELAFRHLEPAAYEEIRRHVEEVLAARRAGIEEAAKVLREKLADAGIQAEVTGRQKEVYSVHKKMKRKSRSISEVFDLLGLRVLVESVRDCYASLGIVHTIWKPMPRRFKDYVAMPKPNMYQALHTTLIGPGEKPFEVQIKTREMHTRAEEGIAAHWRYKAGATADERFAWLRQIMEWQRETVTPEEFLEAIKIDLYPDQVFVFTPRGDIVELPAGSTPIDFAYWVHTEVGDHAVRAKADGRVVPLTYRLKSGESVEIATSPTAHPSRDWLSLVRTPRARGKIRHWLKEREKEREAAEAQAKGDTSRGEKPAQESGEAAPPRPPSPPARAPRPSVPAAPGQVLVSGEIGIDVRYGKCCSPVPGDPIVGYASRGRGVSIHRTDCPNLKNLALERERLLECRWSGEAPGPFRVPIEVDVEDRIGILAAITQAISEEKVNIVMAEVRTRAAEGGGRGRDRFTLEVESPEHLERLLARLRAIPGVRSAGRALGPG